MLCLTLYMLTTLEISYVCLLVSPLLPRITELPWPALCPDLPHVPHPLFNHWPQDSVSDLAGHCTEGLLFPAPTH